MRQRTVRAWLWTSCFLGAVIIGLPFWLPLDATSQNLQFSLQGPSWSNPLGTDHLGRDVLSRLLQGGPRSLGIALIAVGTATIFGTTIGLLAAYAGRWADALLMRLTDLMLAFPGILLVLLLAGLLGGGPLPLIIGIAFSHWPQFARLSRNIAIGIIQEPQVEASQIAGLSPLLILSRQVLPLVLQQCVVIAALGIGSAIMTISALGFLGLGMQPPTPEWGAMITELLPYLDVAPIQVAAPCFAVFLTVLWFTLMSQALADRAANRVPT